MSEVADQQSKRPETCRMFESDFIEWFSRIHPATPFVTWLPVCAFFLHRVYARHDLAWSSALGMVVSGVLAWTFAEYVLHRWVFHFERDTPRGRRFHFLMHGVHHDYPNDKDRLVMPLGVSIPLGVVFYFVWTWTFGRTFGEPFFVGFVLGYLTYDGTHYAVHHFKQTTRIGRFVKRHHMLHHHADNEGGFGVSSPLWDVVFRTMPQVRKLQGRRTASH